MQSHTQVSGMPFRSAELAAVIQDAIDTTSTPAVPAGAAANGALQ